MSIELKRMTPSRAAYFMERFKREEKLLGPNEQAALTYVIDMLEKATAIQQAEAQQPATDEPVQADSSEHLRVIASLGAALRRLSFAAQTTGGTDGPDAELQSAIGQAEQALSLGGIGQAMFATTEPVGYMNEGHIHALAMGCIPYGYVYPEAGAGASTAVYTHPAPRVPMTNEQWDDVLASAGPDLLDLAKQWSDNKVDVYQVINEAEKIVKAAVLRGITAQAKKDTP